MKFVELSKKLKEKVEFVYVLSGKDVFLKQRALEMIKNTLGFSLPEMNITEFSEQFDIKDIVSACSTVPFIDAKRLVIVRALPSKKSEADKKLFQEYLSAPALTTVLVFLTEEDGFFAGFKNAISIVDCNELDPKIAVKWIQVTAKNQKVKISTEVAEKLFQFCGGMMIRISTELEKLLAFVGNGEIFEKDITLMVAPEHDYNIFQITDEIGKRNNSKACEMMFAFTQNEKNVYSILRPMYSHFRRLLFVKISKLSNKELANLLQVKEYAVLMAQRQTKNFSATELKKIVDLLTKLDFDIKSGKISEESAIKTLTINILQTRG